MTIFSPATATATGTAIFPLRPQPFPYFKPERSQSLSSINPHLPRLRPRSHLNARLRCPHASLSPQPPPESDSARSKDIAATFSRIQDRVQIFLAVLFWMSLFFWASAWDGRNKDCGRPNKGSRFRK